MEVVNWADGMVRTQTRQKLGGRQRQKHILALICVTAQTFIFGIIRESEGRKAPSL
jgi:hypothetical protein